MTNNELIEWGLNPQFITPDVLKSIRCTDSFPSRFVAFVTKSDGCWNWPWVAKGNGRGYMGCGTTNGGSMLAYRASWILHFGIIPDGLCVCHRCDNPRCVRPDHLFVGTRSDNMRDCSNKGRSQNKDYSTRKGFSHHNSKLSKRTVDAIKSTKVSGDSQQSVADRFKVCQHTVSLIYRNKHWLQK